MKQNLLGLFLICNLSLVAQQKIDSAYSMVACAHPLAYPPWLEKQNPFYKNLTKNYK